MAAFTGTLFDASLAYVPAQMLNNNYGGSVNVNVMFPFDPNLPQRPATTTFPYVEPTKTTTPSTP